MLMETDLPDDVEALRALVLEQARELEALQHFKARAERLQAIIDALQRHRFGRRSEQLDPDQFELALEDIEAALAEAEQARDKASRTSPPRPRKSNRGSLPAHLERIEQTVDVEQQDCPCCGGGLHQIGEDVSERLDVVPTTFRVLVTRRPRYGCRSCESAVVQAPAPARIVEGGIPTEALIAQVLVAKYADHLPLYRQAQIYARQGIQLDRSTLADWVGRAAWYLRPLRDHILERLRQSERLFADETTAPVLEPGRGRTKTGQIWAYARDDRPWGSMDPPMVAYVYAPDRKAERPEAHLGGFAGILQVDGYGAYAALAKRRQQLRLAFCWAHLWMPPLLQGLSGSVWQNPRLRSSIRPVAAKRPAPPALMVNPQASSQSRVTSSKLDAPNGSMPAPVRPVLPSYSERSSHPRRPYSGRNCCNFRPLVALGCRKSRHSAGEPKQLSPSCSQPLQSRHWLGADRASGPATANYALSSA
jgi:transposase